MSIVNLGDGGVLVEGPRLLPGSRVVLRFGARGHVVIVRGLVVRCEVSWLGQNGGIRYRGAVSFDAPVRLEREAATHRG